MNLGFLNDDSIFLKPTPWPKLKRQIDKLLQRHAKFIGKVEIQKLRSVAKEKEQQLTSINNSKNIPLNATVRQEYVKCGKENCMVKHGPYHYAYWKENGKLRKNIGEYPPSSDTVSDR
jgi:predicted transcriptional regulator